MTRRPWLFALGIAAFGAAVIPPFDDASARLFSIHMLQHMVMLLVAAPLLAASGFVPRRSGLQWVVTVGLLQAVAIWAWHMPVLYDAAMHHDALHILEHLSFVIAAALFWAVVLDASIDPLKRVGLTFGTMLQSSALGALLAFAPSPLYQWHIEHTPVAYDVLAQQQAAGAIMWIPAGVAYLVVMLALLWRVLTSYGAVEQP
ncbi:MAG TPA: cytochrome c oxidase assembly protein [Actinomycetota bacterium]|nr:cytochrome c oxidase assembly protein [Actinomycetota bacterium]